MLLYLIIFIYLRGHYDVLRRTCLSDLVHTYRVYFQNQSFSSSGFKKVPVHTNSAKKKQKNAGCQVHATAMEHRARCSPAVTLLSDSTHVRLLRQCFNTGYRTLMPFWVGQSPTLVDSRGAPLQRKCAQRGPASISWGVTRGDLHPHRTAVPYLKQKRQGKKPKTNRNSFVFRNTQVRVTL